MQCPASAKAQPAPRPPYDDLNRLLFENASSPGQQTFHENFTLNHDGTRATAQMDQLQPDGSTVTAGYTWTYDAMQRLTGEVDDGYADAFTYDLAGNRMSDAHTGPEDGPNANLAYQYNGDDELTYSGPDTSGTGVPDVATRTANGYDANGSLTSSTTNGATTTYTYDARNKTVGYSSGSVVASYVYDDAGNRVQETVNGTTTYYLTDTQNPTGYAQPVEQKASATAAPSETYVLSTRVVAQADGSGTVTYLLPDAHGSTQQLVTASGTVTAAYRYTAFGDAANFTPSTAGTVFLFGGDAVYDPASGLYLHGDGVRATNGFEFVQRDFGGNDSNNQDPLSLHTYLYANADPVNGWDPTGHFDSPLFDAYQDNVRLMDWSFDDRSLSDQAFALADQHVEAQSEQVQGLLGDSNSYFRDVSAGTQFEFAMQDLLGDYVYINPLTLPLGFIGARACFTAGTQVVTDIDADHTYVTRNIESIRPNDKILARDERGPEYPPRLQRVLEVFCRETDILQIVKVRTQDGRQMTIHTTDGHPFWVNNQGWTEAGKLSPGNRLSDASGKEGLVVVSTERQACSRPTLVYTFSIETDHTYFIVPPGLDGAGGFSVWVHNACAWKLRANLQAVGSAVIRAAKFGLQAGTEAACHLVPRGSFSNRAADVVDAIAFAQNALRRAAIDIDAAANGFFSDAANQLGTHTDAYFRRMGQIFEQTADAAAALADLLKEVKAGKFVR